MDISTAPTAGERTIPNGASTLPPAQIRPASDSQLIFSRAELPE
jgi:hypothetical protein